MKQPPSTFASWRWWLLLACVAVGMGLGYWQDAQEAHPYVSVGRLVQTGRLPVPEGAVFAEELAKFRGQQIERIQSKEMKEQATARVELGGRRGGPSVSLQVAWEPGTSFMVLTVASEDADYSKAYCNHLMAVYARSANGRSDCGGPMIGPQMDETLERLDREAQSAESALGAFEKATVNFFNDEADEQRKAEYSRLKTELKRATSLSKGFRKMVASVREPQPPTLRLTVIKDASAPTRLGPGIIRRVAEGGMAGLLVGVGICFIGVSNVNHLRGFG